MQDTAFEQIGTSLFVQNANGYFFRQQLDQQQEEEQVTVSLLNSPIIPVVEPNSGNFFHILNSNENSFRDDDFGLPNQNIRVEVAATRNGNLQEALCEEIFKPQVVSPQEFLKEHPDL